MNHSSLRSRVPLITLVSVCAVVFVLRTVSYSRQDFLLGYDSANYADVADNITKGHGFSVDFVLSYFVKYPEISHPEDRRLSINSLFIAVVFLLLGKGAFTAKLLNIFLGSISIPLCTYFLARSLSSFRSVALLAALSTIVIHNLVEQTYTALADLLLAQFFLLFFIFLIKSSTHPKWHYAAGLCAGLAFLTKTQGLILLPLWLIYGIAAGSPVRFFRSRHFFSGVALCVLVMLPFLVRNFLLFRDPFFTTIRYNAPYDELFDTQTQLWQEKTLKVYWGASPPDYSSQFLAVGVRQRLEKLLAQFRQAAHLIGKFFILFPAIYLLMPGAQKQRALLIVIFAYTFVISLIFAFHQRYEIPLIPPLIVLAWGVLADLAHISSRTALFERLSVKPHLLSISIGVSLILVFVLVHRSDFASFESALNARPHPYQESLIDIAKWARHNLPASAVVMTHDPPLFNFYSGLRCVQIPYDEVEALESVMRHYGVTHAVPWTVDRDQYVELAKGPQARNPNMLLLNPGIPYASLQRITKDSPWLYRNNRLRLYSARM